MADHMTPAVTRATPSPASLCRRACAAFLDLMFVILLALLATGLAVVCFHIFASFTGASSGDWYDLALVAVTFLTFGALSPLIFVLYHAVLGAAPAHATWGKRAFRILLVPTDAADQVKFARSLGRAVLVLLFFYVAPVTFSIFAPPATLLGYLVILTAFMLFSILSDPRRRAPHDRISRTVVVNTPSQPPSPR